MDLGGGDSQTSTSTTQLQYSPEEAAARQKIFDEAARIYGANSNIGPYPGPRPVGFSGDTQAGRDMLRNYASGQGQQISNMATGAMKFGLQDVLNPNTNPYLSGTVDTALRKINENYLKPGGVVSQLRSDFVGNSGDSGGTSTRAAIAGGIADRGYANMIGDTTAGMYSGAYNRGLDTFEKSMAFAPNMYQLGQQPGLTMAGLGKQEEDLAAANENYAAAGRQWGIDAPWRALSPYANIVTGAASPSSTTSATAPDNGPSDLQKILGMGMQAAAIYSMG